MSQILLPLRRPRKNHVERLASCLALRRPPMLWPVKVDCRLLATEGKVPWPPSGIGPQNDRFRPNFTRLRQAETIFKAKLERGASKKKIVRNDLTAKSPAPRPIALQSARRSKAKRKRPVAAIEVEAPMKRATKATQPFPPSHLDVFITCQPGLTNLQSSELDALAIKHTRQHNGVQLIRPTMDCLLACHLYLGTASEILLRCGAAFSARAMGELERKIQRMPWSDLLDSSASFKVQVKAKKSRLLHTTAIRERVVHGIHQSTGSADGHETTDAPPVELHVSLEHDQVQVSLATSATPLHQRGYRLQTAKAPLREDLAHAMLYSAEWMTDSEPLAILDPFCGSGTIVIEAVAMLHGLAPGRLRPAPFCGTTLYNEPQWKHLIQEATVLPSANRHVQVFGSDRDSGAVEIAKANARRAGVEDLIDIRHLAVSSHPIFEGTVEIPERLLIVTNGPFGRRVSSKSSGRADHLLPLYQSLSSLMNKVVESGCDTRAVLLTDNPSLVRRSFPGFQIEPLVRTIHGGIDVAVLGVRK